MRATIAALTTVVASPSTSERIAKAALIALAVVF
jgi:hypothetical protein